MKMLRYVRHIIYTTVRSTRNWQGNDFCTELASQKDEGSMNPSCKRDTLQNVPLGHLHVPRDFLSKRIPTEVHPVETLFCKNH